MFDELLGLADRVQDKGNTADLQQDSVDDDTKADGQAAKSNVEKNRANHEGDRFSVLKDVGLDGLYDLARDLNPDPDQGREEPGHSEMDIFEAIERSALATGYAVPKKTELYENADVDNAALSSDNTHEGTAPEISSKMGVRGREFIEEELLGFRTETIWVRSYQKKTISSRNSLGLIAVSEPFSRNHCMTHRPMYWELARLSIRKSFSGQ